MTRLEAIKDNLKRGMYDYDCIDHEETVKEITLLLEVVEKMRAYWKGGESIDVTEVMKKLDEEV